MLVIACLLPFVLESYRVLQLTVAITYAIAALGLNIVTGYSGQISLAQGAFFGIGAYTSAVLIARHAWNYALTLPVAAGLAFAVGVLFGLPALRIRGLNLAIVTLALAVTLRPFLEKFSGLTGGKDGIIFVPPTAPGWTSLDDRKFLYFFSLAVAVLLFGAARGLMRGRIGRAMVTLRDNEIVAETMGIDAARVKILAFGFAAMYAGVAGALYAMLSGAVTSDSFPLLLSVALLAAIVIGGVGTVTGAIYGALFIEFMPDEASRVNPGLSPVIYGVSLILFTLLMPAGVVGLAGSAFRRVQSTNRRDGGGRHGPASRTTVRRSGDGHPHQEPIETSKRARAESRAAFTHHLRRTTLNKRIRRSSLALAVAGLTALLVSVAAVGSSGKRYADPGITNTSIKIGSSFALSGPATAYSGINKGAVAYFNYLNAQFGGVKMADGKKRKINFVVHDDGFAADRALANAVKLVESDKVFAIAAGLGTTPNVGILQYVNRQKVPDVFIQDGTSAFGQISKYPYTIGWQPAYSLESYLFAQYLKKNKPNAKVAILAVEGASATDYVQGFLQSIKGSKISVVKTSIHSFSDPTMNPYIDAFAQTNADTVLLATLPGYVAQSLTHAKEIGWKPLTLVVNPGNSYEQGIKVAGDAAAQGLITLNFLKDPAATEWTNDPAIKQYKRILAKYGKGLNPNDYFNVQGFAWAETLRQALAKSGPTRTSFMRAVRSMKNVKVPWLVPGATVNTSPKDGFPVECMAFERFSGSAYHIMGKTVCANGKTPLITEAIK
jgi:branched-chain amino acid transport system permease protein